MRHFAAAIMIAALAAPAAHSAELASYSPASLVFRAASGDDVDHWIVMFPPGGKDFALSIPLIPRRVAYGSSGLTVYATALRKIGPKGFANQPGIFKIELDPLHVTPIQGLDAFYSIDRFAVSRAEDRIVFAGAKGTYSSRICGVYEIILATGTARAILESSDCRAGSPWQVLSLSPDSMQALVTANRGLALLDLSKGSITKLDGRLWGGAFSPDGKWIAAVRFGVPNTAARAILIDRTNLAARRDVGAVEDPEVAWSPDSKFLLHAVYRPACPIQNPLALETLDVETGKRLVIEDSICNSGSSRDFGWIRADIKR
ncbi:MAG TPA: hypothetical protein VGL53_30215 [Bryobacteraceae bacterium]|jgi:hypothetical protein